MRAVFSRFENKITMWARASSRVRKQLCYCFFVRRIYEYRRHLPHYQSDHKAILVNFPTHERCILPESARDLVFAACLWGNGERFKLYGMVVMPDHVHLVFTPLYAGDGFFAVAEILQGIKSTSAHQINLLLGRQGQVWQHESFDHVLRCEEGIAGKVDYVIQNPVRAGLVRRAKQYRWLWVCPELRRLIDDSR